jgi:hypothetical protein
MNSFLQKNGLGHILGDSFANSSVHPGDHRKLEIKKGKDNEEEGRFISTLFLFLGFLSGRHSFFSFFLCFFLRQIASQIPLSQMATLYFLQHVLAGNDKACYR